MSNMNYCKFENTYAALMDCADDIDMPPDDGMGAEEMEYKFRLLNLCCNLALNSGREIGREFHER